jgi:hypothetical protein
MCFCYAVMSCSSSQKCVLRMARIRPSEKPATKCYVPENRKLKTHSHRQASVSVQASKRKFLDLLATSKLLSEEPLL